jgi:hypothetical protein
MVIIADHDGSWSTGFVNLDCDEGVDPCILTSARTPQQVQFDVKTNGDSRRQQP